MPRYVNLANYEQFAAINLLSDAGHIGGPLVIPNCVQVTLNWSTTSGRGAHNVLYGRVGGIPSPTVAQANAILAALTTGAQWTALAAFLVSPAGLASVSLRSVATAELPILTSTGTGGSGTDTGQSLPNEVALCVTLRTGKTGAQNRGRMFIPDYGVSALAAGNVVAAAAVTATSNWANTITTALGAQGYTWVLGKPARKAYVGTSGTSHPARDATSEPITSAVVRDNHWDSQRRRGLK